MTNLNSPLRRLGIVLALAFASSLFGAARAANPAPAAAAAVGKADLLIEWDHQFRVYEETAPGTWALVKTVKGDTAGAPAPKSALLPAVPAGVHTYRVTAYGEAWGETAPSAAVSTGPAVDAPTNPRVRVVVSVTVDIPATP
jgi:hypothetical protein